MRFISLFSGIGGFDLGFERAGMECVAQVEFNADASKVLARHFPNVPRFGDVRDVGRHNLPPADLICGGFPCQDVSVAGRRAGLAGGRSGLWFEFLRILTELKPEWAVIENVPGLLSSNDGRDFAVILHGLVECGYCVGWRVLDAQHFGVAQRRRRVFIVGHLGSGRAAEILFERASGTGNTEPGGTARERTAASTGGGTPISRVAKSITSNYGKQPDSSDSSTPGNFVVYAELRSDQYADASVDATLASRDAKGVRTVVAVDAGTGANLSPSLTSEGYDGSEDGRGRKAFVVTAPLSASGAGTSRTGNERNEVEMLVVPALTASGRGTARTGESRGQDPLVCAPIAFNWNAGAKHGLSAAETAGTLRVGHHNHPATAGAFGVRRLTPTECERLQGFPDGWTDEQSNSQRYRQLGNAVCVNVAEWLGARISESEPSP